MEVLKVPHNEELENTILGTIIYNEDAILDVIDRLKLEYFYTPINKEIYEFMIKLFNNSKVINSVTITSNELINKEQVEILYKFKSRIEDLGSYIDLLENLYIKRALIKTGHEIASLGFEDDSLSSDELINKVSSVIFNSLDIARRTRTRDFKEVVEEAMEELYRRRESPELPGLDTGFMDFNFLTGGLQSGDEIIIAGRPSCGKTALMLKIALNTAKAGNKVVIFSYEMPDISLANRLLSIESDVNLQYFRSGQMEDFQLARVDEKKEELKELPIKINDGVTGDVSYIAAQARTLAMQHQLDLLCVDYIQLMPIGSGNRNVEFGHITKILKNLAKELKIPVIALSQLNRAVEGREDKRPILSDLRESGNIEQDADIVAFIYRHEMYYPGERKGQAELIISKHRNGPLETIDLSFIAETANFEGIDG